MVAVELVRLVFRLTIPCPLLPVLLAPDCAARRKFRDAEETQVGVALRGAHEVCRARQILFPPLRWPVFEPVRASLLKRPRRKSGWRNRVRAPVGCGIAVCQCRRSLKEPCTGVFGLGCGLADSVWHGLSLTPGQCGRFVVRAQGRGLETTCKVIS